MTDTPRKIPKYSVGESLGVIPPAEGHMPIFDQGSFDLMTFASGLSSKAIKDWQKGKAAYGVYIEKSIPVLVLNLGSSWTFEVYLNLLLESEEQRRLFFEGDPQNLGIHLYLVSSADAVVQAARSLQLASEEMLRIKEACFDQVRHYPSKDECFIEAELLLNQMNSKTFRRKIAMHPF
ncbi:MAG: hypothetical protein R6U55_03880 [Desulfovermiculus sp.]